MIKVLCTTVGETAADLLNEKAGLGLTGVSVLMSALLAVVLVGLSSAPPPTARACTRLAVALISVVGTLHQRQSDRQHGRAAGTTTTVFGIVLAIAVRRLVPAASGPCPSTASTPPAASPSTGSPCCSPSPWGTAADDLVSERMDLGYWLSAVLFASGHRRRRHRPLLPRPGRGVELLDRLHPHPSARAPPSATTSPSPPATAAWASAPSSRAFSSWRSSSAWWSS
ncbi:hypothetical protein ACRAWF_41280 [Streptomyces sp. L7]